MRALTRWQLGGLVAACLAVIAVSLVAVGVWYPRSTAMPPPFRAEWRERSLAALAAANDDYKRWVSLPSAALALSMDGDPAQATAIARETLALAPKYERDWNHGNALHKANLALGHLALRAGDREGARAFLKAAGDTPGSPQLDSFGPNMSLASAMLEAGEREAVLDYIERTTRFWKLSWGTATFWQVAIRLGFKPGFGPHILF